MQHWSDQEIAHHKQRTEQSEAMLKLKQDDWMEACKEIDTLQARVRELEDQIAKMDNWMQSARTKTEYQKWTVAVDENDKLQAQAERLKSGIDDALNIHIHESTDTTCCEMEKILEQALTETDTPQVKFNEGPSESLRVTFQEAHNLFKVNPTEHIDTTKPRCTVEGHREIIEASKAVVGMPNTIEGNIDLANGIIKLAEALTKEGS